MTTENPAQLDYSKYTILIVDDNPTNLGVLFDYLEEYGFRILVSQDGESGLKRAEYARPDIILLDVMMPGMDGFETCRRLKASPVTKDIPVIFMTALASTEDKVKGLEEGAVDYVTKPIQQAEVLARLTTHLRIRDLTQRLQKKNLQLETSGRVGQQATSILDLNELLTEVARLIRAQFGYYFVAVWLLNDRHDGVVLRASDKRDSEQQITTGLVVPLHGVALDQVSVNVQIPREHRRDSQQDGSGRSIVAAVCRTRQYYVTNDAQTDPMFLAVKELPETRSEMAMPLLIGAELLGVLDIQHERRDAFDAEDKAVLLALADQVAIAIRNARLYYAEKQRRALAESMEETGRVLSSSLDMGQVPGRILERLAAVVPYERGAVLLQEGDATRIIAQRGFPPDERVVGLSIPIHEGDVFQQLVTARHPIILDNVAETPVWQQVEWLPINLSWLGVPLVAQDRVVGMISLTRHEAAAFSQDDAMLVAAFAGQAAIALENARLYDDISQFNEQLEQMVAERTEELQKAYETLERLDRAKTDFIEVAAHELRTPLTLIRGYAALLDEQIGAMDESLKRLAGGILTGERRLYEIVNNLLDVSKITSKALNVCRGPVRINEVIERVRLGFKEVWPERRLTLITTGLTELPIIQADPDLLHKVFYHLIVNAIKYTPDGGTITVSGKVVTAFERRFVVEIIVSDTGIGIDAVHHELIFEKFYQVGKVTAHSSGKTKFKGGGPGLGLSIAKGIVLAHSGKIWVESAGYDEQACPGSQFHVCLPLE
jgi:signal transduction histidine kinase/CheY-like chemotaxis protein